MEGSSEIAEEQTWYNELENGGGDLRREEPNKISRWKEMPKVWTKLEKGFMMNFMEKLVDYDKGRVNLAVTKVTKN